MSISCVAQALMQKSFRLQDNSNGECSEVGMYLAMSRVADREGYPEVAEGLRRYAFEEAEHANVCRAVRRGTYR